MKLHSQVSLACPPKRGPLSRGNGCHFIVLEGLDGSGKSTLASLVGARLGALVLSTPLRELAQVRGLVDEVMGERGLARTLWYAAQVAQASAQVAEARRQGLSVVMDRYWMSTLAYAAAQGEGIELKEVIDRLEVPDVTVILKMPSSLRRARLFKRDMQLSPHDKELLDPAKERQLHDAYRRLSGWPAAGRVQTLMLDGAPPETLVERLLQALGLEVEVVS